MGWAFERIVEKSYLLEELKCPICTDLVEEAVQTPCQHVFCKICILNWLEIGNLSCPVDRIPLSQYHLKTPSRIIKKLLDGLSVRCKNCDQGCSFITKLETANSLYDHENNQCIVEKNLRLNAKVESLTRDLDDKDKAIKAQELLHRETLYRNDVKMSGLQKLIDDQNDKLEEYKCQLTIQRKEIADISSNVELPIRIAMEEMTKRNLETAEKYMKGNSSSKKLPARVTSIHSKFESNYNPSAPDEFLIDFSEPETESLDQIEIFVECWIENEFKTISLNMIPSDKIVDIKMRLKEETGILPNFQVLQRRTTESRRFRSRMICQDLVFEDTETLSSCEIKNKDTLSLVSIKSNVPPIKLEKCNSTDFYDFYGYGK